jgi:hypothetical protein
MTGITWESTETFAGTLNGNGKTIENFAGKALFKIFAGTVKNINFININHTGIGFLSAGNVNADVTIENCVFQFETLAGGDGNGRNCLIGYQVGKVATLKDVYIQMPENTNNYKGYLTTHAITGLVFDNVYMVGGNGLFHASAGANATFSLAKATITGTEGVDYFIYKDVLDANASKLTGLAKTLLEAAQAETLKNATVLTKDNIDLLKTATTGYYVLGDNIDLKDVEWSASGSFTGTLNGKGHTISGLNFGSPAQTGLFSVLNGGATVKNLILKVTADGNNNGTLAATISNTGNVIENVVIDITKLSGAAAGGVARNLTVNNGLIMKNVMIIVRDSLANGTNGLLFGNYGADRTCTVENFYIVDLATAANKVTALHNGRVTINGTVNQYTAASQLDKKTLPTQLLKDAYDVAFAG